MPFLFDHAAACYRDETGAAVPSSRLRTLVAQAIAASMGGSQSLDQLASEASSALFAAGLLGGGPSSSVLPADAPVLFSSAEKAAACVPAALAIFDRALLAASISAGAVRRKAIGRLPDPGEPYGWQPADCEALPDSPCVFDVSLMPSGPPPYGPHDEIVTEEMAAVSDDDASRACAAFGIGAARSVEQVRAALAIGQIANRAALAEVLLMARVIRDRIEMNPLVEGKAVSEAIGYGSLDSLRNAALTSAGDDVGRKRAVLAACQQEPGRAPALIEARMPSTAFSSGQDVLDWAEEAGIACPKIDSTSYGFRIVQRLPAYHLGNWREIPMEGGVVFCVADVRIDCEEMPEAIWERPAFFGSSSPYADSYNDHSPSARHSGKNAEGVGDWGKGHGGTPEGSFWITTKQGRVVLVKEGTGDQKGELLVLSGAHAGLTMTQATESSRKERQTREHAENFEATRKELAQALHGNVKKTTLARVTDEHVAEYLLDKDGWLTKQENVAKHMADVSDYMARHVIDPDDPGLKVTKKGERPSIDERDDVTRLTPKQLKKMAGKSGDAKVQKGADLAITNRDGKLVLTNQAGEEVEAHDGGKVKLTQEQMGKLRERYRKWDAAQLNPDKLDPDMKAQLRKSQERARLQAERAAGPWYQRALGKLMESPLTSFVTQMANDVVLGGKSSGGGGLIGGAVGAAVNVGLKSATGWSVPLAGMIVEQTVRAIGKIPYLGFPIRKSMDWLDEKSVQMDKWMDANVPGGKVGARVVRGAAFAAGMAAPFVIGAAAGGGLAAGVIGAGVPLLAGVALSVLGKGVMKMTEKVKAGAVGAINKMRERQLRLQKMRAARTGSAGKADPAFAADEEVLFAAEGDPTAGYGEHAEPVSASEAKSLGWTQEEYEKNVRMVAKKYAEMMGDFLRKFGRDYATLDGLMSNKAGLIRKEKPKSKKSKFAASGWCAIEPPIDPSKLGPLVEFDGMPCTKAGVRLEMALAGCEDSGVAAAYFSGEERFRLESFTDGYVRLDGYLGWAEGGKLVEADAELLQLLHAERLALFSEARSLFLEQEQIPDGPVAPAVPELLGDAFSDLAGARRRWLEKVQPLIEKLRGGSMGEALQKLSEETAASFQGASRELADRYGPAVGFAVFGLFDPRIPLEALPLEAPGFSRLTTPERILAVALPAIVLARAQAGFADGLFAQEDYGVLDAALFSVQGATLDFQRVERLASQARADARNHFWSKFAQTRAAADFSALDPDVLLELRRLLPCDLGMGPRPEPGRIQTTHDRQEDLARLEEQAREVAMLAMSRVEGGGEKGAWGEAVGRARLAAASLCDFYGASQARATFAAGLVGHGTHPSLALPAMARVWLDDASWPAAANFAGTLPSGFLRELGDRVVCALAEGWSGSPASDAEFSAFLARDPEIAVTPLAIIPEDEAPSSQRRHSYLDASKKRIYSPERLAVHRRIIDDLLGGRLGSEKSARLSVNVPCDWPAALGSVPIEMDPVMERLAVFGDDDVAAEAYDVAYGMLLDRALESGLSIDVACPPYWGMARFCDLAERLAGAGYAVEAACFLAQDHALTQDALFSALADHPDVSLVDVYEDRDTYFANEDYDECESLEAQFAGEASEGWEPSPRNPLKLRKKNPATNRWQYKNAPTKGDQADGSVGNVQKVSKSSVDAFRKAASSVQGKGHQKMHEADAAFDKHVKGLSGPQKVALARHVGVAQKLGDGDHKKAHEALKTALQSHALGERNHVPDHPGSGGKEKLKQATVDAMNATHKKAFDAHRKGEHSFIGHEKVADLHAGLAKKVGDKQVVALAQHLHPDRKFGSAGEAHQAIKNHIEQSGLGIGEKGGDKARKVEDAHRAEKKPKLENVVEKVNKAKKEDAKEDAAKAKEAAAAHVAKKEEESKSDSNEDGPHKSDDPEHQKMLDHHAKRFNAAKKQAEEAKDEEEVRGINKKFHEGVPDEHKVDVAAHLGGGSGKGAEIHKFRSNSSNSKSHEEQMKSGAKNFTEHLLKQSAGLVK